LLKDKIRNPGTKATDRRQASTATRARHARSDTAKRPGPLKPTDTSRDQRI